MPHTPGAVGTVYVMVVSLTTVKFVTATPLKVALFAPVKPVPVIVAVEPAAL